MFYFVITSKSFMKNVLTAVTVNISEHFRFITIDKYTVIVYDHKQLM